ncbi:MAG: 1-deoxy-D-xylulose-5-phosphate synthase [Candidatus Omnitrophica bacterium]|nr:1-deoxy-D-xylulose-5-phosphate synthase [Candidatus Omnitrophota bacterium]
MPNLLNQINSPSDLKKLPVEKLPELAGELRAEIINVICKSGGHLASSLGAVELTIALHYLLNTPEDIIVWDVGHQAYAHKLLTGRRERFGAIRQMGGLSGFPNKNESPYDPFTVGHSSTSISTALGVLAAFNLKKKDNKVVAVIGDAALAGGMAFEALNHAGHLGKNLLVILNDNEISISPTIGALSKYLNKILTNPIYNRIRKDAEVLIKRMPKFGYQAFRAAKRFEEGLKNLLTAGIVFEEMGFRYFGPIDGHNIDLMLEMIGKVMVLKEPVLLHIITKKGKGYKYAEACPAEFHSAAPFEIETGIKRVLENGKLQLVKGLTYTQVFGEHLVELAKKNDKIVAITAAMPDGTGLAEFSRQFPSRFFDVGIAEQHAVGFAAGLARGGFRPVVSVYSTFLQRAYDQIVHDAALQELPVVFALDRAGLVGEDGPTHHGLFDISYLRHIPKMAVMAPKDTQELKLMLDFAAGYGGGPIAIRYPRGTEIKLPITNYQLPITKIELGKSEIIKEGKDVAIIALGSMVWFAYEAAALLGKEGIEASVINARFIKPLDKALLQNLSKKVKFFVTIEEGVIEGGFGSAVMEFFEQENINDLKIKRIGLPSAFIEHGKRDELFSKYKLTPEAIAAFIKKEYNGQNKDR